VLAGEIYLSETATSKLLKSWTAAVVNRIAAQLDCLTDREMEVQDLIGRGQTTRQIAETLQLGGATVDTYRARIKDKMSFRNATELQHFAIRWVREREYA
jgi:DNA-binding NarL/FixJ family response regulator